MQKEWKVVGVFEGSWALKDIYRCWSSLQH